MRPLKTLTAPVDGIGRVVAEVAGVLQVEAVLRVDVGSHADANSCRRPRCRPANTAAVAGEALRPGQRRQQVDPREYLEPGRREVDRKADEIARDLVDRRVAFAALEHRLVLGHLVPAHPGQLARVRRAVEQRRLGDGPEHIDERRGRCRRARPACPWPGVKLSVEIAPGDAGTSGAGSTCTGSLNSGMFCRYENSAPTLTPPMFFDSVMPMMWMLSPYAVRRCRPCPSGSGRPRCVTLRLMMHAPGATTMPPIALQVPAGSAAKPVYERHLRQDVGGIAVVEAERAVQPRRAPAGGYAPVPEARAVARRRHRLRSSTPAAARAIPARRPRTDWPPGSANRRRTAARRSPSGSCPTPAPAPPASCRTIGRQSTNRSSAAPAASRHPCGRNSSFASAPGVAKPFRGRASSARRRRRESRRPAAGCRPSTPCAGRP